ncbi:MAG: hypothetical protein ACK4MF_06775 [Hyphomicrobiaceae bacterium]
MPASGRDESEATQPGTESSKAGQLKGDTARADRLEAALRENLKRRKAAARARAAGDAAGGVVRPKHGGGDT